MLTLTTPPTIAQGPLTDPLSPRSLMVALAYIHQTTPWHYPGSRLLGPRHLRQLAHWLEWPPAQPSLERRVPHLRTARHHPLLAAHLLLLLSAGLLHSSSLLALTPTAHAWLHEAHQDQICRLLAALQSEQWQAQCEQRELQEVLPLDYVTYLQQQLQRQLDRPPLATPPHITHCRPDAGETAAWVFHVSPTTPLPLHFNLLQLGQWSPPDTLTCTPLTLGRAIERGYSLRRIRFLLETALDESLSPACEQTLACWTNSHQAYQVRQVYLLSTQQDEQLAALFAQRRLRDHLLEQISPRQAIISPELLPPLQRWLAAQDIHLDAGTLDAPHAAPAGEPDPATLWLALNILIRLSGLLPLPFPSPHAALHQVGQQLPATTRAELDLLAAEVQQRLETAITGRDAFFPAYQSPSPHFLDMVRQAIHQEQQLYLTYQSLAEPAPRGRRIQPWRLSQHGRLYYLHAYCYRAGRELVFRLDRVSACEVIAGKET